MSDGWYPQAVRRPNPTNYWIGNTGRKAVVLHIAEDYDQSAVGWLASSASGVSAHFYVAKDGTVYQFVSIENSAWANGLTPITGGAWASPEGTILDGRRHPRPSWVGLVPGENPNHYTVSVEHEGHWRESWTSEMFSANTRLLKWIASETGLVYVPHQTLIGHSEISPVDRAHCPGRYVDLAAVALAANARTYATLTRTIVYEVPLVDPSRIALDGTAALSADLQVVVDWTYSNGMAHLADDLGFVELRNLRPL